MSEERQKILAMLYSPHHAEAAGKLLDAMVAEETATLRQQLIDVTAEHERLKCAILGKTFWAYGAMKRLCRWVLRLRQQLAAAQATNEVMRKQIEHAVKPWTVSLFVGTEDDPFKQLECKVADIGHSEHVLLVECDEIREQLSTAQREVAQLLDMNKMLRRELERPKGGF